MKQVHLSKKVETRIEALKSSGKAGANLADKAKGIINDLASGAAQHCMDAVCSFTKFGEKRIRNCRKYDLGCGYRLITLQRGETVYIPYLGPHDQCQRWLERNSRLKDFHTGAGRTIPVVGKNPARTTSRRRDWGDPTAEDPVLLRQYTDRDLRRVFSGLVKGAKGKFASADRQMDRKGNP